MESFSIIIPTYNEANNLEKLIKTIHATSYQQRQFEVVLVDDNSNDGSPLIIQQLKSVYPYIKMIVRQGERSLSQSVIEGCHQAHHPLLIIMDADLSHPTNAINNMLEALEDGADLVLGSRYIPGGSVDNSWSWHRRWISKSCAWFTKTLLGLSVKDPLSGFFALKKSTLSRGNLANTSSWKIALEILVKCHCTQTQEVAIHFAERYKGKSKLNAKISYAFIKQLGQLTYYRYLRHTS